jgi:phage shock protein PspC (stress-responsive transcriptional regulator)
MNEADHATLPPGSPGPPPPPQPPPRRLYREPDDKRITGVCAGLGDYLGIDPTLVRLAMVLLTLTTGVVLIGYIVAAVVVPERPPSVPRTAAPQGVPETWSTGAKVLLVLVAVVVLGIGNAHWWFNVPTLAIGLVAVGVWLLVVERDGSPFGGSTTHGEKTGPPVTAGSAGSTTLLTDASAEGDIASGITDASSAHTTDVAGDETDAADHTLVDGTATDDSAVSAGPQGEVPPPVPPWGVGSPPPPAVPPVPPVPRPPRGTGLPLGVMAALLIGAGVVSLLAVLGVGDVGPVDALAGGLLLVGVAMVVGAWRGRARALLGLGLPLVGLLLVADVVDVPLDAGAGDRTRVVTTRADLEDRYELTAGSLTLDLRDLPLGAGTRSDPPTVEAEVGFGELIVIVPHDANVEVDARAGVGDIVGQPDGDDDDGIDVDESFELDGSEGGGHLVLDLQVGLGEIEVRRA